MAFKLEFPGAAAGLADGGGEVNRCGVKLQVSTQTPSINTHTPGERKGEFSQFIFRQFSPSAYILGK